MLSKPNRLPSNTFSQINSRGHKIWGDYLICRYILKSDLQPAQFGIVVSTKVSKKAVDRNRIKRLISENLRLNIQEFNCPIRAVFIAKQEAIDKDYHMVGQDIKNIIKKINQKCPKK